MSTVGKLLEEIKIGTEEFNENTTVNDLSNSFSEDDNSYKTYKLINASMNTIFESKSDVNEASIKILKKLASKIKTVESKDELSSNYSRMKLDSIAEDYNSIVEGLESRKVLRSFDKDELSKILALVNYNIIKLKESADVENYRELNEMPEVLKPFFNKQVKLIVETIM